ncbi:hypothetical protein LJC08_03080 [Methanimicrococcus sp. OttesenSCG-928-J09]|nr:hypothetical protein [Methanimicrococcus sp. OttesenSCG-928-J09]
MGEKKGVGNFLRKTFALKKNEEELAKAEAATKTAAKPAAKAAAKPAAKTAAKPATKTAAKPAAKTAAKPAAKTAAKPAAKTAAKPATKTAVKPAAKTAVKPPAKTVAKPAARPATKPATAPAASKTVTKTEPIVAAPPTAAKTKTPVEFSKNMTKADNVRLYIYQNYLKPAKLKGQSKITLVAGDVHTDMGLKSEMPTVTAAMKTRIDRLYDVEILDIKPPGGANSKLTVRYDLKNLYMEEEAIKPATEKVEKTGAAASKTAKSKQEQKGANDAESSYLILKELEEKLRSFVSDRVEARFGKEWWKGTDMSFLAERWNERRIMNDRTNIDKKRKTNEPLINYASFSDYRRIINNPFAWDAFEEYFPDRVWIIQRLKELDPIRNAIMHHTPLEDDDYLRLELYARDILKIIDKPSKSKT